MKNKEFKIETWVGRIFIVYAEDRYEAVDKLFETIGEILTIYSIDEVK